MGVFKVGDRVRVIDGGFSETGRVAEIDRKDLGYNVLHFADPTSVICTYFTDAELELVAPAPAAPAVVSVRRPTPVRRPKGRFTVRQGQTLRGVVHRYYASSLSATRWYPR